MAEEKTASRSRKTTHEDPVAEKVQEAVDAAEAQGFYGVEVDPTPNANYTVAGVLAGKPTPESDPKAAAEARRASEGR